MIVIIDYGLGNLRSIEKALQNIGADVVISNDPSFIDNADKLILPGVGAFHSAMIKFDALKNVVIGAANDGKHILGICLGMQMLTSNSEEGGYHRGIDIIPGSTIRFPVSGLKVPHIGWNSLIIKKNTEILNDVQKGSFVYFVHSYYVKLIEDYEVASCKYGLEFSAIITNSTGNVIGVQFHPEKSGLIGLRILRNFMEMEN